MQAPTQLAEFVEGSLLSTTLSSTKNLVHQRKYHSLLTYAHNNQRYVLLSHLNIRCVDPLTKKHLHFFGFSQDSSLEKNIRNSFLQA